MSQLQSPEVAPRSETGPSWNGRGRRVMGGLGIGLAAGAIGYGGGLIAASAWPAEVAVGPNYRAEVALSSDPLDGSRLKFNTTAGTVEVAFDSMVPLAPGIKISPRLSDTSLETASQAGWDVQTFVPSDGEIEQAISATAEALALRFGLGTLAAEALLLAGVSLYRRGRPSSRQITSAGAAGVLAFGVVAGQAAVHYQPDNYASFTTNGLLSGIYDNRSLLTDIEARSNQMGPFMTSLLALSSELQQKFVGPESDRPVAAKFLLVSDIHGVNQYGMLKKIISERAITAVIDSGDLINFGQLEEIEASDLRRAIEDLGVPYLFARGNHDSNSPDSYAALDYLAKAKNVILLQPSPTDYTAASIDGLRVAGFNDPRFFGDNNQNNDLKQLPAITSFNDSWAKLPMPDVVVSHEPAAADGVKRAGLTINGHLHAASLKGNHIQVGSLTGGGLFSHSAAEAEGISVDQPSGFDILTFDDKCRPLSLTRLAFRSVVQGNPRYDSVGYFNLQSLDTKSDPQRQCSSEQGVAIASVPVIGAALARTVVAAANPSYFYLK